MAISNPKENQVFILSAEIIQQWMQAYPLKTNTVSSHTLWMAGIQDENRENRAFCQTLGSKIFLSQDRRFLGSDCESNRQVIIDMQQWLQTANISKAEFALDYVEMKTAGLRALQQKQNEQINLAAGLMLLLPNITGVGVYAATVMMDALNASLERAFTMNQNTTIIDCGYAAAPVVEESHWMSAGVLALAAGIVATGLACLGFFRQGRSSPREENEASIEEIRLVKD